MFFVSLLLYYFNIDLQCVGLTKGRRDRMDRFKKILKKILFPNLIFTIMLFPISMVILILTMVFLGSKSVVSYISYLLSFYALLILCLKAPIFINFFKKIKNENKYILRYREDVNLRINISLYGSLIINVIYSIFQLCL